MAENRGTSSELDCDDNGVCDISDMDCSSSSYNRDSASTSNELDSSCSDSTATVTSLLDRLRNPQPFCYAAVQL